MAKNYFKKIIRQVEKLADSRTPELFIKTLVSYKEGKTPISKFNNSNISYPYWKCNCGYCRNLLLYTGLKLLNHRASSWDSKAEGLIHFFKSEKDFFEEDCVERNNTEMLKHMYAAKQYIGKNPRIAVGFVIFNQDYLDNYYAYPIHNGGK